MMFLLARMFQNKNLTTYILLTVVFALGILSFGGTGSVYGERNRKIKCVAHLWFCQNGNLSPAITPRLTLMFQWQARKFIIENTSNSMIVFKGVCVVQTSSVCIHSVNVLIYLSTGQVITASIADIIANYSYKDILRKLAREKQTDVAPASYDDSYLGEIHYSRYLWFLERQTYYMQREILLLSYLMLFGILCKFFLFLLAQ